MYVKRVAAACAALALLGATSRATINEKPYLHAQRLVDVGGGRRLNLYCSGSGSPTVVLDAAIGSTIFVWNKVQPLLSKHARVCAYDRAGYGFSDPGGLPHTTNANVNDLHALLKNAGIAPPYVLVAHSLNGFDAWLFADRYRSELAGMVLIEPSNVAEGRFASISGKKKFDTEMAADLKFMKACASKADHQKLVSGDDCVGGADPRLSPALNRIELAHKTSAGMWDAVFSERASLPEDLREVITEQRTYRNLPLIVLSAGVLEDAPRTPAAQRQASKRLWSELRAADAAHSNLGTSCIVPGSRHYIQVDKPGAVVAATLEVIRAGKISAKPSCA
ncbi:MAG: alpha/beta hydrolase, partial [Candidatus Eremiobacteraeota bacterium]|nr:alpha/beta hydrolase [Candidatus Eremiobacteraeota bacterium]